MLIEFRVGNYLSFKSVTTFSMVAANIKEYHDSNVFTAGKHELLKSAAIYGANASGKSNLVAAMGFMQMFVMESQKFNSTDTIPVIPFLLNTSTEKEPSSFEIIISIDEVVYRYGFEVTENAVIAEWLYETKQSESNRKTNKCLFIRDKDIIEVNRTFKEARGLESKTRDNGLFLSKIDSENGETAKRIIRWISQLTNLSGLRHSELRHGTCAMIQDERFTSKMKKFFQDLDLGFSDVKVEETGVEKVPVPDGVSESFTQSIKDMFSYHVRTYHNKFDSENNHAGSVEFDMRQLESKGTNKIFDLSGPFFETLIDGGVLVIDEMDASIHPLLVRELIKLFNSKENNPNNAQLIFTTHDTNLLSYADLRRDQVYFTEKDIYGVTALYSLAEFKVRNDRTFEKDYIQGKYGAIPYIGNLSFLAE